MAVTQELHYAPIRQLANLLQTGQISARELLQVQLSRIEAVNPLVNAVVSIDAERAMAAAARADQQRASGAALPVLHGVPCAFKDTHATAGLRTTFGSPLLREHIPVADDLIVQRMLAAGVVTVGKTNVPEFAAGSHTFNPVFGVTRNPYDLSRSAGGSSGGAAAALAAGMVPVAEGSDLGGSLRNPASFCNVVGLRPTAGRVPDWPSTSYWDTMAVSGPLGRTVDDVALLLSVIAGPDPRVAHSLDDPGRDFAHVGDLDLTGVRVAFSADLGAAVPVEPAVQAVLTGAARTFAELGCVVEEDCIDFGGAEEVFRTLRAWAFAAGSQHLLREPRELVKASLRWNIEQGLGLTGQDVARADAQRNVIFQRAREFFSRYDVLLLPTSQVVPFDADDEYPQQVAGIAQQTYLDWMRSCYLVTVTGCPALSVPAGFSPDGLPVGVQLVGPHRAERDLLRIGRQFERATGAGTRRPTFVGVPARGPAPPADR